MIYLFTDFGWAGPYIGEMKAVLARELGHEPLIDLMHDAPACNPVASAYLLTALSRRFQAGDVCLAVVDPGVGDPQRRAIRLQVNGVRYVGPDNGIFALIARQYSDSYCEQILWQPDNCSDSFHGRDLFAPAVCRWLQGQALDTQTLAVEAMVGVDMPDETTQVIYIDRFGNAITGLIADRLSESNSLFVGDQNIQYAPRFSQVSHGELFWYQNSMGLVEIAANQAHAANTLNLSVGSRISVSA